MLDTQTTQTGEEETAESQQEAKANPANEEENLANKPSDEEESKPSEEEEESGEDMQEKYKQSSKEAVRLYKENKKSKEEARFHKAVASAAKNQDAIHEIANDDPELADKVSRELWEKPYSPTDVEKGEESEVDQKIDSRFKQLEAKKNHEEIESLEETFLSERQITPGSVEFRNIMDDYSMFSPNTSKEAKRLLEMAYARNVKDKPEPANIEGAPASYTDSAKPSSVDTSKKKAENEKVAQQFGVKSEYVERAEKFLTT